MTVFLTIIHVLVALLLIVAVLLQSGKGGGLAGSIGGGMSSTSVLGGRTAATFLTKTTTVLATTFLLSCIVQALLQSGPSDELPTTASERMLSEEGPYQVTPFAGSADDGAAPSVLGGVGDAESGAD